MPAVSSNISPPLELLCMLSRTPAAVDDLLRDTAWTNAKLQNYIRAIRAMGIVVYAAKHTVWIADESWPMAEAVALGYHERTYGDDRG